MKKRFLRGDKPVSARFLPTARPVRSCVARALLCAMMGLVLLSTSSATAQNVVNGQTLFEADYSSGNVFSFTPGGARTTFASGFSFPSPLAFNSAGDLFVGEEQGGRVFRFVNNNGILSPTPVLFASGLFQAEGMAINSAGDLYVACYWGSIIKIAANGAQSTFASGLTSPYGAAFNSGGDLFVSQQNANSVLRFTPGGTQSTFAAGLALPRGLAFDSAGNLFVANNASGEITRITPGGAQSTFATIGFGISDLAFDGAGNLFVSSPQDSSIYEITPGGAVTTFATGLAPLGLAFQPIPEPSAVGLLAIACAAVLCSRGGVNCLNSSGTRPIHPSPRRPGLDKIRAPSCSNPMRSIRTGRSYGRHRLAQRPGAARHPGHCHETQAGHKGPPAKARVGQ